MYQTLFIKLDGVLTDAGLDITKPDIYAPEGFSLVDPESVLNTYNDRMFQSFSNSLGIIYILAGLLLLCFILHLLISVGIKNASRKKNGVRSLSEDAEISFQKEANASIYIEKAYTRQLYTNERGQQKLLVDSDWKKPSASWFILSVFIGGLGFFFLGLSKFYPDQVVMRSVGRQFALLFLAYLAYWKILRGKAMLRMRYEASPESDARWLKGKVIRVDKAMRGHSRFKEGRSIIVEYSENGQLYYIHKDTHVYKINKCPQIGDEVDIFFSSILTKAITKAEMKDAKYKIIKGILILVLIFLIWLHFTLGPFF